VQSEIEVRVCDIATIRDILDVPEVPVEGGPELREERC